MIDELAIVPPGGGEVDHSMLIELPEMPRPGDWIARVDPSGDAGTVDYIAGRANYVIEKDGETLQKIFIECEMAIGPYSSKTHKSECQQWANAGRKVKEY